MNEAAPFQFEIGPYWITLPNAAVVTAEVTRSPSKTYQMAHTHWVIAIGRFQIFAHLDIRDLGGLKRIVTDQTHTNSAPATLCVNGLDGMTHGGYGPARTWIDGWFRKGDTTLCLCLQSVKFPATQPNDRELAEHRAIIASIRYCPDYPAEMPPLPPQ